MTAGKNCTVTVWRMTVDQDDSVGGALMTGTVVYDYLPMRIRENPVEQLLMQQGLQTEKTFSGIVQPGNLDIRERDEIEISNPYDDLFFEKRFRIVSVVPSTHSIRDPRKYIRLNMVRSERAHRQQ